MKKMKDKTFPLQPEKILITDTTKNRINSTDHKKKDIVQECNEYNDYISLQNIIMNNLPNHAFFEAQNLFIK